MDAALAEYLQYLCQEKNASGHTVKSYREDLTQAVEFFKTRLAGQAEVQRLTARHLRAYAAWLHDQGYAKTTIARRVAAVRSWCRFLCRQGTLTANPAEGLRGPRQDKKLPHFLGADAVAQLVAAPPANGPLGLRDRALFETLYSAGLRVSELTGLDIADLDFDDGIANPHAREMNNAIGRSMYQRFFSTERLFQKIDHSRCAFGMQTRHQVGRTFRHIAAARTSAQKPLIAADVLHATVAITLGVYGHVMPGCPAPPPPVNVMVAFV
jgi:integrase/recombinase XerC